MAKRARAAVLLIIYSESFKSEEHQSKHVGSGCIGTSLGKGGKDATVIFSHWT